MILSLKEQLLSNLNPGIVYMCIAMFAILIIISLVKKAFILSFVVLVACVGMYTLIPLSEEFRNNYNLELNEQTIVVTIKGEVHKFGTGKDDYAIKHLDMIRQDSGEYDIKIQFKDGSTSKFTVPGFMRTPLLGYIDKLGIDRKLLE